MIEKVSGAAAYAGSGAAVVFGLTPSEWQAVGVIGGLVVAFVGLVVNGLYKHMHYKLALAKSAEWNVLGDGE